MLLTRNERKKILDTIKKLVPEKHINVNDPRQDYGAWLIGFDSRYGSLLNSDDVEEFESGVRGLLQELGSSHTALFRPGAGIPAVHAINATIRPYSDGSAGERWMFVDVIEDGAAHRAGIKPGDLILTADGSDIRPPKEPVFRLGGRHELEVAALDGSIRAAVVEVPNRAAKDRPPMVEPRSLSHRMINAQLGYLRVASFPGAVGTGFARALDAAIADLKQQGCTRLIIDLRGNVGGGLGSLRLMSYLCSGKLPIGHTVTRARLRKGYDKNKLARIDRIPAGKGQLLLMALRFKVFQRDRSLVLATEGLGPQPFHGNIVLLTNEFTHSAAEMVASFAKENGLATLVGTRTGGQVLGGANFKLVNGYRLRMPVAGWYNWAGKCIEGAGVEPDVHVTTSRDGLTAVPDSQLVVAMQTLSAIPA